jgi:hypothetical protein
MEDPNGHQPGPASNWKANGKATSMSDIERLSSNPYLLSYSGSEYTYLYFLGYNAVSEKHFASIFRVKSKPKNI